MNTLEIHGHAPDVPRLTDYDETHLVIYLRLLDAEAGGTDWRDATASILGIDTDTDPVRAQSIHRSHLARAQWMTEVGYAHLLGCQQPPSR